LISFSRNVVNVQRRPVWNGTSHTPSKLNPVRPPSVDDPARLRASHVAVTGCRKGSATLPNAGFQAGCCEPTKIPLPHWLALRLCCGRGTARAPSFALCCAAAFVYGGCG
jgi:hypothetical protein